ncbi:unnamed protein product [Linum trigynum]|uniref:MULE transposase domain-containing protein n=1 Tax=Linum trigynum TaxID=586398 RepID=A0AAV2CLS0_9ROSI
MYNRNYKTRLDEMDAIQFALHGAEQGRYHICLQKDSNNVLTNLFFAHPTSIQMLHAWLYVILIDSTYKTNRYGWPWVEIIGVTPVKKNFNIACAIIKQETKETYEWLLRCIKGLLGDTVPNVIVTDKEGGLLAYVPVVFPLPHTVHLLCLWHVNNCVKQKFEQLLGGIANREVAQAVWKKYFDKVAWSWTQEGFLQKINGFERFWTEKNIKMVDYVRGEWLPHQTMWAKCYTNHVFHLGNTSSNRVESSHSSFKTFHVSGRGAIDTYFAKNHNYMEHQFLEVVNELHKSLNRNLSGAIESSSTFLRRVVSCEAIKLMLDEAGSAPPGRWMDSEDLFVFATIYNIAVMVFSYQVYDVNNANRPLPNRYDDAYIVLPIDAEPGILPPTMFLSLHYVNNHYIRLYFNHDQFPIPPLHPIWHGLANPNVAEWGAILEVGQNLFASLGGRQRARQKDPRRARGRGRGRSNA